MNDLEKKGWLDAFKDHISKICQFTSGKLSTVAVIPNIRELVLLLEKFQGAITDDLLQLVFLECLRFMVPA